MPDDRFPQPIKKDKKDKGEANQAENLELSPEIKELVMKRVDNILKNGSGITNIGFSDRTSEWNLEELDSILEKGLIGSSRSVLHEDSKADSKIDKWVEESKNRTTAVWVNIIGRGIEGVRAGGVAFVVDMSRFKESFPASNRETYTGNARTFKLDEDHLSYKHDSKGNPLSPEQIHYPSWTNWGRRPDLSKLLEKVKTFGFDENSRLDEIAEFARLNPDKIGNIKGRTPQTIIDKYKKTSIASIDTGFMIARRVPPRDIGGIVVGTSAFGDARVSTDSGRSEILKERVNTLVREMLKIYKGKPELIKPIYNTSGDLIWPKQMSHAEIVEMKKANV